MTDSQQGAGRLKVSNSAQPKPRHARTALGVVGLCMMAVLASGCWEEVTEHSPGVYSGKSDQLTSSPEATASRADVLQKRFDLVQRDR